MKILRENPEHSFQNKWVNYNVSVAIFVDSNGSPMIAEICAQMNSDSAYLCFCRQ